MSKLSIKNLDLYYGDFKALKNVNLEIEANKITAFIGPSGCGKSTLMPHRWRDPSGRREYFQGYGRKYVKKARRNGIPEAESLPDEHL